MAMSQKETTVDVAQLITKAHAKGYAVAHCRKSLCRDTDDGEYVSISNVGQDGYYVYDPMSANVPDRFELSAPQWTGSK